MKIPLISLFGEEVFIKSPDVLGTLTGSLPGVRGCVIMPGISIGKDVPHSVSYSLLGRKRGD
jgi:hypothetical protein